MIGEHPLAIGVFNSVSGEQSLVVGAFSSVTGDHSLMNRVFNSVTGDRSKVIGVLNSVSGGWSLVIWCIQFGVQFGEWWAFKNGGTTHLSALSMVTSDQMLRAMPRQSNPGPMLALVAGTLTTTRLRSIAASLRRDPIKAQWRGQVKGWRGLDSERVTHGKR